MRRLLVYRTTKEEKHLRIDRSLLRVTTVASVACRDISLDRASDVLLCIEDEDTKNILK